MGARPANTVIDMILIHNISQPPQQYIGNGIANLINGVETV